LSQLKSPYLKGTLIIGVLVMHFTITYFYTAPAPLNVPELEEASGNYMKPFFHQHWNLFAPEPPALNVVVSVSLDQGSTWNNLSEEILNNHYTWRITHHGRMALAFGNGYINSVSYSVCVYEEVCASFGGVWAVVVFRRRADEGRVVTVEFTTLVEGVHDSVVP